MLLFSSMSDASTRRPSVHQHSFVSTLQCPLLVPWVWYPTLILTKGIYWSSGSAMFGFHVLTSAWKTDAAFGCHHVIHRCLIDVGCLYQTSSINTLREPTVHLGIKRRVHIAFVSVDRSFQLCTVCLLLQVYSGHHIESGRYSTCDDMESGRLSTCDDMAIVPSRPHLTSNHPSNHPSIASVYPNPYLISMCTCGLWWAGAT